MNYEFQVNILSSKPLKSNDDEVATKVVSMEQAKNVAQGILTTISVICLIVTFSWLPFYWNRLAGFGLFLFLAVPFSASAILSLKHIRAKKPAQTRVKQAKNALLSMQGVGFACWFFDVLSTIFVVNIKQSSEEVNILGWPYGALGALAYYVPITFVAYYLLFKVKSKESFYATAVITAVSLFMGLMNLNASFYNLAKVGSFSLTIENFEILGVWLALLITLSALNIMAIIKTKNARNQEVTRREGKEL
jgi:hypothetical protein